MELYLIEDYGSIYPDLRGKDLTQRLVIDLLREYGYTGPAQIVRLEGGKPVLEEGGLHFSVSHTEDIFACVISEENIGLDIQLRRKTSPEKIASRYFTEEEQAYMKAEGEDSFYKIWTRKESYSKLTGEGLAAVIAGQPVLDRTDVKFNDLVLGDGLYGCICTGR